MNLNFYIKVGDYMPEYLPSPRLKRPCLKEIKSEALKELPIILVGCELNEV